jgi:hypothetical protein
MNRKAQSAVEFLVTYGWAFLMIFGFVGTLFYLDVLDLGRLMPDRCEFSSEIVCEQKIIIEETQPSANDGAIFIKLANNLGASLVIDDCYMNVPEMQLIEDEFCASTDGACGSGNYNLQGSEWAQGTSMLFNFSDCNMDAFGISGGNKQEVTMIIEYHAVGSSEEYKHNVTGRIFTNVETR